MTARRAGAARRLIRAGPNERIGISRQGTMCARTTTCATRTSASTAQAAPLRNSGVQLVVSPVD
jgi:hypothetical protein